MPQLGVEPTIPAFERVKIVHASDRAAPVIDSEITYCSVNITALTTVDLPACL
jgi:hypothetical protein